MRSRSRFRLGAALVCVGLAMPACEAPESPAPILVGPSKPPESLPLVGTAVTAQALVTDPVYAEVLATQFNAVTPENEMKFKPVHPAPTVWDFEPADRVVDFAAAHGMKVRGHALVWHHSLPEWITGRTDWTRGELEVVLREHVTMLVRRYRGRVHYWDVVNEAFESDGSRENSIWQQVLGPDYIADAFRWAHEADPEAKLFLNEAGAEIFGPEFDALHALLVDLLDQGVPIHGVGMEMHVRMDLPLLEDHLPEVAENMSRIRDLGLEVQVTEMDVGIREPATAADLERQASIFREVLSMCVERRATAFVMWGFTDRYSWVPEGRPGYGAALPLDEDFRPKPAYYALRGVLPPLYTLHNPLPESVTSD